MAALRKLVMPKLGLTMDEGTVAEWPLAEGASFAKGDIYLVVETEKVATEVEAPAAGRLVKLLVPQGETVPVGTPLAEWEPVAGDAPAEAPPEAAATVAATAVAAAVAAQAGWRKATATEHTAARRMVEAKQGIPHFYLATEIEAGRLLQLRADYNRSATHRASVTHLVVAALARTLVRHPGVNRVWEHEGIRDLQGADIGIAVHTEQGLMVPVLRNAHALSLDAVAKGCTSLAERARTHALTTQDIGGGALSVSNAGMHNVTWMTSIINPGQSAILGVGSERQLFRPDAQGAPRLAREIGVVLSCDHRVHDGVGALTFLNEVKALLEAPDALFA